MTPSTPTSKSCAKRTNDGNKIGPKSLLKKNPVCEDGIWLLAAAKHFEEFAEMDKHYSLLVSADAAMQLPSLQSWCEFGARGASAVYDEGREISPSSPPVRLWFRALKSRPSLQKRLGPHRIARDHIAVLLYNEISGDEVLPVIKSDLLDQQRTCRMGTVLHCCHLCWWMSRVQTSNAGEGGDVRRYSEIEPPAHCKLLAGE